jgi:hypothetical protein
MHLVTVDGRQATSVGLTLAQLVTLLAEMAQTPMPFGTSRGEGADGSLPIVTPPAPGSRNTSVDDPPPSRFTASSAPS